MSALSSGQILFFITVIVHKLYFLRGRECSVCKYRNYGYGYSTMVMVTVLWLFLQYAYIITVTVVWLYHLIVHVFFEHAQSVSRVAVVTSDL